MIIGGQTICNQMPLKSLKTLLESCGLIFVKLENPLDQHFNRVLNEINPPYKVLKFYINLKTNFY